MEWHKTWHVGKSEVVLDLDTDRWNIGLCWIRGAWFNIGFLSLLLSIRNLD